ncbi:MAG TPA: YbdD/YjiX family protein [Gemmatimonadaceae bacterium]|nr:YbdD/YjiX family protein [Gemmatimonadaceae bacterium]
MNRLTALVSGIARTLRAMLGVPDYERYMSHCQSHHPDTKPMTKDQFAADLLERKYSRPGTRCC